LRHVTIDCSPNAKRSVLAGALVALGVLIGMLAIWTPGAEATDGPDAPERVFALTINDKLLRFDGNNPSRVNSKEITGLVAGESLVGIDFRPSAQPPGSPNQGKLYGVGDRGYIYTIDSKTADAKRGPRITADLDGDGDTEPVALKGDKFGIDFNPVVDRLRIVSDANQNLRVNVDTGALADFDMNAANGTQPDKDLKYAAGDPNAGQDPNVTGVAYRNSQPSAFDADPTTVDQGKTTELYDIDARTDDMSEQDPPNDGTLNTVGSLGVNTNKLIGFDIVTRGTSPAGDRGYAALDISKGGSKFYKINLNTGDATKIGTISGGGAKVEVLAIPIGQE
jgi:hypothetical protein